MRDGQGVQVAVSFSRDAILCSEALNHIRQPSLHCRRRGHQPLDPNAGELIALRIIPIYLGGTCGTGVGHPAKYEAKDQSVDQGVYVRTGGRCEGGYRGHHPASDVGEKRVLCCDPADRCPVAAKTGSGVN